MTNPVVATALFVAGFYGLYLGGLFDAAVGSHIGHLVMNRALSAERLPVFYWVVIGVDPTPRPIPPLAKVAVVFASLPLHAFLRHRADEHVERCSAGASINRCT